ncbi:hypothetical protein OG342_00145 [Streptomyces bobili]|uniref:hypothetical protein n=1 Tax=Streptomyces TaxID=1883 RepID=UPI00225898EF|nr:MULTISPECIES: hypothetical protein [Streptomyces]MCX5521312.1 hypothetical protein [Streptomyces bobili]MDX3573134.1 hypothetical protein [Streptomyces sp. ID05-47C]
MPSASATSDRHSSTVPLGERTPSAVDRVITVLSWWWVAAPLILVTPAIAHGVGYPVVRDEFGLTFALTAVTSAVAAPVAGFIVALVARQRGARRRFVIMGVVTSVPLLFFWAFGVLLAECPDGYHC